MVRIVDRNQRRDMILSASVKTFITSAAPVSSEALADEFSLSSATVRNTLAELEESGYLTHPYTSAGRIPTDKGYRYYVDFLMSEEELKDEDRETIIYEYKSKIERLEDILDRTSELISKITHNAGIVSFLEWEDRLFFKGLSHVLEQPEFNNSERVRLLVKALEDRKNLLEVINRNIEDESIVYIGREIGCPDIENCSLVVSKYSRGTKQDGRLAVLGPRRMSYSHIVPTLEFISEALSEILI